MTLLPSSAATSRCTPARAVADPTRRAALEVLGRRGEQTVGGLAQALGVELPILSRHLAVLREAGLVTQKQAGRNRLYRLEPEPLRELVDWAAIFSDSLDRPAR